MLILLPDLLMAHPTELFWNKKESLNWKSTNLVVQLQSFYGHTGIYVYEKGRRGTRTYSGCSRGICSSLSLNDVAGNRHNAGNGTHRTEPCSWDNTTKPWWHAVRQAYQRWDKILVVPPYLNFTLLLRGLKISLPPPSGILSLTFYQVNHSSV